MSGWAGTRRFQGYPKTGVDELVRTTRELLDTIEAYDLEDELDEVEKGQGPVTAVCNALAVFEDWNTEVGHE